MIKLYTSFIIAYLHRECKRDLIFTKYKILCVAHDKHIPHEKVIALFFLCFIRKMIWTRIPFIIAVNKTSI